MTMNESVAELRGAPRAAVRLPFQVKSATTGEFSPYLCGDISETGLFLESDAPPKRGTLLRLEWADGDEVVEGVGRVVWARHRDDASETLPAGAGVKFVRLSTESLRAVKTMTAVEQGMPNPRSTMASDERSGTHPTLPKFNVGTASNDTTITAEVEALPGVEAQKVAPVADAPVTAAPTKKVALEKTPKRGTRSKAERKAAARAKRDKKRRHRSGQVSEAAIPNTAKMAGALSVSAQVASAQVASAQASVVPNAAATMRNGTTFTEDPVGGRAMRHRGTPMPDAPRLNEVENTSPGLISSEQARAMLRKERDAQRHTNRLALYGALAVAGIFVAYLLSTMVTG